MAHKACQTEEEETTRGLHHLFAASLAFRLKSGLLEPLVIGARGERIMAFMSTAKQLVGITDRRCGTCRWWPGEREIKFMSQRPIKVETTGNAKCQARGISVSGGQSHCSKWTKWERLG